MKEEAQKAIAWFEKNEKLNLDIIKDCDSLEARYLKLYALFPTADQWHQISARQLVFYLHHRYEIDLGVCPFYRINDRFQYCIYDSFMQCLCIIPEPVCVFRDEKNIDYPRFNQTLVLNF